MPRGKAHSNETKAAVMAALLAGQGISEIAQSYKLPLKTVEAWAYSNPQFRKVQGEKRVEFDGKIATYLGDILDTLSFQARFFRTETWLHKQDASSIAVLHGVLADKGFRILAAAEEARNRGSADDTGLAEDSQVEPEDPTG